MKMGYAETDITPEMPVTTVGFNRTDNVSRGIMDHLMAQVSVWEDNEICCLVTIDNIGFNKKDANLLRDRIGTVIDVPREKIMLSFSHTHAAPNIHVEREYYELLCNKICRAAETARSSMSEVSVGWGNAVADIGNNRRDSSDAIDRRAGMLKICTRGSNDIKLLILRLTAHCNVLKRDNYLISADYFGTVRKAFTDKYHCPVMIVQGSAGNIAPKYYNSTETPIDGRGDKYINTASALDDMAQEVIQKVEPILKAIDVEQDVNVHAYSKYIPLQSKIPSMDEAHKIADEALKYCGIDGQNWLKEVESFHDRGISFLEENLEMQYFCISDWCLCGIPNETMTEFALKTEQLLENPYFFFNGYTNGCDSYFPTKEEYDLGGYEVYWAMLLYYEDYGRVYPYKRESFDIVITSAVKNYLQNP